MKEQQKEAMKPNTEHESPADWSLQKRQPDDKRTTWMFLLTAVAAIAGVIAFIILGAWIDAHPYVVATVVLGLAGVAFIFIHRLEKRWKKDVDS